MWQQPSGLISVLLDPAARPDEQDDAAMDLAAFDDPEAEAALLRRAEELAVVTDDDPYLMVGEMCGESLAEIWCRRGRLPGDAFARLRGRVLEAALAVLEARRPDLLEGPRARPSV
jgi:hypothetical protein